MIPATSPIKKRKKPTPVTAMALKDLRIMGFTCDKVEQRIPRCFITRDFIGCIDVIAFREGVGILGIQVTGGDGGNHAARITKALAEPRLRKWLMSGGRFEVWSYAKRGEAGTRKLFKLRREELKIEDFPPEPAAATFQSDELFDLSKGV